MDGHVFPFQFLRVTAPEHLQILVERTNNLRQRFENTWDKGECVDRIVHS